ncbi:hypothetical protein [Saccharothrix stipae]
MTAALVLIAVLAVPCLAIAVAVRISNGYHRRCHAPAAASAPQQPTGPPPLGAGRRPTVAGVLRPVRGILAAHQGGAL